MRNFLRKSRIFHRLNHLVLWQYWRLQMQHIRLHPLKQGLRHIPVCGQMGSGWLLQITSTKTRIKTDRPGCTADPQAAFRLHPLKQGLRHAQAQLCSSLKALQITSTKTRIKTLPSFFISPGTITGFRLHPLKQGLRLLRASAAFMPVVPLQITSTKTRIKTADWTAPL